MKIIHTKRLVIDDRHDNDDLEYVDLNVTEESIKTLDDVFEIDHIFDIVNKSKNKLEKMKQDMNFQAKYNTGNYANVNRYKQVSKAIASRKRLLRLLSERKHWLVKQEKENKQRIHDMNESKLFRLFKEKVCQILGKERYEQLRNLNGLKKLTVLHLQIHR